jgi:hypothetical protein
MAGVISHRQVLAEGDTQIQAHVHALSQSRNGINSDASLPEPSSHSRIALPLTAVTPDAFENRRWIVRQRRKRIFRGAQCGED